jgi:hypothetical protein
MGPYVSFLASESSTNTYVQIAIPKVIETLDEYYLSKEDWDAIVELGVGDHSEDRWLRQSALPAKLRSPRSMRFPLTSVVESDEAFQV